MTTDRPAINTWEQIARSGGGIAICKHYFGIRDVHVSGWELLRLNAQGKEIVTDPNASWYDHGRKVFHAPLDGSNFHARQRQTFELAQAWVAKEFGEHGPWVRNAMGDFVPERVQKAHPIKRRKQGA